jgi:small subunit ribosomal protein S6
MRRYEQIVILDSDLSEDTRQPVFDRLKELIPQYNGFLIDIDEWGQKKLAYEIKKKPRGYYAQIDFCGFGDLVDEMERFYRIDDRILKYMTVVLEKEADLESIKAEMSEKEAKKAEAATKAAEEEAARQAAEAAAAAVAPETQEAVAEEIHQTEMEGAVAESAAVEPAEAEEVAASEPESEEAQASEDTPAAEETPVSDEESTEETTEKE